MGGRPLLFCTNGCTRAVLDDAARLDRAWTAQGRPDEAKVARDRSSRQAAALRLWAGSVPCPGTAAALYLDRRGIGHAAASLALRFRADCGHPEMG